jgi:hypothetical protein
MGGEGCIATHERRVDALVELDDGKFDEQEVVVFCPDCAAREFGEIRPGECR